MWTNEEWSQRHIDKTKLASKLESMGITVLGWCNRKPELTREDGQPVDWGEVESAALKLFKTKPAAPQPKPDPVVAPPKEEVKKPAKKPKPRSRKRTAKKK